MSKKETGRSLKMGVLLQLANLIPQFLIPRILIIHYGSQINGMISSILQIMSYLTIFEAGIIAATIYELYSPIAKREYGLLNAILRESRRYLSKVFVIYNAVIVGLAVAYPLVIGDQVPPGLVAGCVIVIGASRSLEYLLCAQYRVLLAADQKVYVIYGTQLIGILLQSAYICTVLLLGGHLIVAFAGSAISFVVRYVLMRRYTAVHYGHIIDKTPERKHQGKGTKVIKQTKDVLVHQIAYMVCYNTDVLLLTVMTTLEIVSIYAVYKLLFNVVKSVNNVITNTFAPFFGNLIAAGSEKLHKNYSVFELMIFALIFGIFALFALMLEPFIVLYTSGQALNYVIPAATAMFMLSGFLTHIRIPIAVLVQASGSYKETKMVLVIEAGINLVLSVVGIVYFGLPGALAGTAFSALYRTVFISRYVFKNVLKTSCVKSLGRLLRNTVLAGGAVAFIMFVLRLEYNTVLRFILNGAVSFVIIFAVIAAGNYVMERKTAKNALSLIKSLVK